MLHACGRDLWMAEGPVVSFYSFPYPTRMVVVRLRDGSLWLWSPIAYDLALAHELEALGPVRHLVAPNALHHLSLSDWVARYPDALLHAAPGLARKRRDLPFAHELSDAPHPDWAGQIDQVAMHGSLFVTEILFYHRASSTALVCDLIQRFDPRTLSGLRGTIMRLNGLVGPNGSTPREWRASFVRRRLARRCAQRALEWNAAQLIIAHGQLPEEPGRQALARGLRWLV